MDRPTGPFVRTADRRPSPNTNGASAASDARARRRGSSGVAANALFAASMRANSPLAAAGPRRPMGPAECARVLLSDRDIRAEIAAGRVALDPFDETLLQPSSVDLRLDRHFRTFNNHAYTHIDPALQQDDLTRMVEPAADEAFVLHPGEFVLGLDLRGHHAARRRRRAPGGQVEPGSPRAADPLDGGLHRPGVLGARDAGALQRRQPPDPVVAGDEGRAAVPLPAVLAVGAPVRLAGVRLALPGPARPDAVTLVRQLPARPVRSGT